MMKNLTFVSASLIAMVCSAQAVMIAPFPGLPKMIEEADAIAIIRVDEHLKASPGSDLRTTHRCYVYQSLKGNLPKSERVVLSLIDTRTSFVSPFSIGSTHLAFLSTNQIGGESTFRNMQYEGSILRLSPFGHESEPDGWDLERKIKILLERSIAYRDREQQREKELFLAAITGMSSPLRRELEEGHKTKGDIEQRAKSYRISPILDFDGITAKAVASYQSDGNYWTIQVNLFSKGREDVEKERPPTLKVFNRAGTPLTVISDNGYSDIGNLFVMYRVEAESIEEIANLEVEFKSIKRRFQFRSPKEEDARYFIHFGFQADVEPRRILTTEFRTGEPFHALAGDLQELKGLIEVRDGKFHAVHLKGNTGSQGGVYAGSLTNGIPVFAQGGVGSGGWVPLWFAVSTNADGSALLHTLEKAQVESIWNALWNAAPKPVPDPLAAKEIKRLEGTWNCRFGVTPDLIRLSILPNHKIEITGEKDGQPWTKTGEWKIVNDKCVILFEGKPPNFIVRVKDDFFLFDPWATNMLSKLLR